jgi:hypothetical protein
MGRREDLPLEDGEKGRALHGLPPERRAHAWFARAWNSGAIPELDFELFGGAAIMIEGLVYHYRSFVSHHKKLNAFIRAVRKENRKGSVAFVSGGYALRSLTKKERAAARACAHEAIAYLNRLGQFYYFAKSTRINRADDLRRVTDLMPIRMKFAAHRSIDAPRGEAENVLRNQAFSFAHNIFSGQGIEFEFFTDDGHIRFRLQEEHPLVMKECFAVLQRFYPQQKRANKAPEPTPGSVTPRAIE